jgi:prepilin-type N-terminal cleavage/methylation domain-containing protein
MLRGEEGFTLVEMIVTLILVGILCAFTGLFMISFLNGYFSVKNNTETAMKAQVALDRISSELKDLSPVSASVPLPISVLASDSQITYTTKSGAVRSIQCSGSKIYLTTSTSNVLIDNIEQFKLNAVYGNVYNTASDDVEYIDIGFTVSGYGSFGTRIFPRVRIPHPPS